MLKLIKKFLLTHEPFRPVHTGNWIRALYCRHYLPGYVKPVEPSILDAACGNGRHSVMLRKLFPNAHIEGVDLRADEEWKTFTDPQMHFHTADLTLMDEDATRDVIVSIDTLEHISGNERVLREFFKALRPGGILYLAVPCEDTERFVLPKRWFGDFYDWADVEHIGEMRPMAPLVALMKETGFEILLSRQTFTLWGHLAWEIEHLLHGKPWGGRYNPYLMPLYKLLGWLDILFPIGTGNNLVVAKRG